MEPDDTDPRRIDAPSSIPTIYADDVYNVSVNDYVVKFNLIRAEKFGPDSEMPRTVGVGQVVMPLPGFISVAVFFKRQLDALVEGDEDVAEMVRAMSSEGGSEDDK